MHLPILLEWGGSPSHFSAFGGAHTLIRRARGMEESDWGGAAPINSRLYVDGGISIELLRKNRVEACSSHWELIAKGFLGKLETDQEKLGEEGAWSQNRATL